MENVSGIIAGRAKKYAIEIVEQLNAVGYDVQIFQLNAATMGVPQSRERVFFIARHRDLGFKPLVLEFNEAPVPFGVIADKGGENRQNETIVAIYHCKASVCGIWRSEPKICRCEVPKSKYLQRFFLDKYHL